MSWDFHRIVVLMFALGCASISSVEAEDPVGNSEVEVTGSLISSLQLSDAASTGKLYDRLAYGKGQFLRSEGKSRRSVLLALEGQRQHLVRLFDLAPLDYKLLAAGTQYYFGGVLSKIERTEQGNVEVTIIYSNLSEVAGKFYSRQAQDFAQRTVHLQQQNEKILTSKPPSGGNRSATTPPVAPADSAASTKPGPPSEQSSAGVPKSSPTPANKPRSPESTQSETQPSEQPKAREKEAENDEDKETVPRNRPVLKRRVESDRPPTEAEPSRTQSSSPHTVSQGPSDDVVVYRRKDSGSRLPTPVSSRRDQSGEDIATESDRPVLRRKAEVKNEEKEADGMVSIPEGYVTLGSDSAGDVDLPINRVLVAAFFMDKTEVTNEEYKLFCEATGHAVPPYWVNKTPPAGLEKHPVTQVSWFDAQDYAHWAGKRLPSEAEWERAAKGPNSFRYAYGNGYDPQKANTTLKKTCPVGQYSANEFGLFDMTGNVFEWTNSLFKAYPYQISDGREENQASGARVIRGGGFSSNERDARCLVRQKDLPENGSPLLGFRCARNHN